jgi:putative selenium metabolism protein SsnA
MLIEGGTIVTLDPPEVSVADLRVEGERIVERGPGLRARPSEEVLDASGRLVLPGLVNAHTHLYGTLARGMRWPATRPRKLLEILEQVWWRLDRALDEETVYLSALVGGIEAALCGTTVLLDHHSSPGFIEGSLATVKRALEEVGIRSVLCYEVSDRNGVEGRDAGLAENVSFQQHHQDGKTRGMIGAHASFTLSEESLDRLAAAVDETGSSLHVHVAEDRHDVSHCHRKFGLGLAERFKQHGLITSRSILAHCVHLGPTEVELVHASGGWIAHNPRSNMNNSTGYAPTRAFSRAALGTDGIDQDMFAELRVAYLKKRDAGQRHALTDSLQLLAGGHRLAAALFGLPLGKLDVGGPADLLVLEYPSPTPLNAESLAGHLLFGIDRYHLRSVIVAGRFVVREREVVGVDVRAAYRRARKAAPALWKRMESL